MSSKDVNAKNMPLVPEDDVARRWRELKADPESPEAKEVRRRICESVLASAKRARTAPKSYRLNLSGNTPDCCTLRVEVPMRDRRAFTVALTSDEVSYGGRPDPFPVPPAE